MLNSTQDYRHITSMAWCLYGTSNAQLFSTLNYGDGILSEFDRMTDAMNILKYMDFGTWSFTEHQAVCVASHCLKSQVLRIVGTLRYRQLTLERLQGRILVYEIRGYRRMT